MSNVHDESDRHEIDTPTLIAVGRVTAAIDHEARAWRDALAADQQRRVDAYNARFGAPGSRERTYVDGCKLADEPVHSVVQLAFRTLDRCVTGGVQ